MLSSDAASASEDMTREARIAAILGAAPAPDAETATIATYVRACVAVGLHLLLVEPGTKVAGDYRSAQRRNSDDKRVQEDAKAAGDPRWEVRKSGLGIHLATDEEKRLVSYLAAYRKRHGSRAPVNLAVSPEPSGLIIVDCDTRAEVEGFLTDAARHNGSEPNLLVAPTVVSPGQMRADTGEMIHRDGGHYWFTVDEPLPSERGQLVDPVSGYVTIWARKYVLIPPSVRPEGPYQYVGRIHPAPDWMTQGITDHLRERAAVRDTRRARANPETSDAITRWGCSVAWDDLLTPQGWTITSRPDGCGCDVWTAPGDHSSPRSATAHDAECGLGRYSEDAPLHIWTDGGIGPLGDAWRARNPGTETMSRLQVYAAYRHGGNLAAAVSDVVRRMGPEAPDLEGIEAEAGVSMADLDAEMRGETSTSSPPTTRDRTDSETPSAAATSTSMFADPSGASESDASDDTVPGDPDTEGDDDDEDDRPAGLPLIREYDYFRGWEPPRYLIENLVEEGGSTMIYGPPGVGKSTVLIDMLCHIAMGIPWMNRATRRARVLYLPGEGIRGAVARINAWELAYGYNVGADLIMGDDILQIGAGAQAWDELIRIVRERDIKVVVFDTLARASVGLDENQATDMGKAVRRFDRLRKIGVAVIIVHHSTKAGDGPRGSSALSGSLEGELLLRLGNWWDETLDGEPPGKILEMHVNKQKNGPEDPDDIQIIMVPAHDSIVVTGPSGRPEAPSGGAFASPRKVVLPEPAVELLLRIRDYLWVLPAQGATRGDLHTAIAMSAHTRGRTNATAAHKVAIAAAVDLGIRLEVLRTLTGKAAGTRYVQDPDNTRTDDQIRAAAETAGSD